MTLLLPVTLCPHGRHLWQAGRLQAQKAHAPSKRKTASVLGMLGILTPALLDRVSAAMAIRFLATLTLCCCSGSSAASGAGAACTD